MIEMRFEGGLKLIWIRKNEMIPGRKNNINKGPVAGGNKTYLKN